MAYPIVFSFSLTGSDLGVSERMFECDFAMNMPGEGERRLLEISRKFETSYWRLAVIV